MRQLRSCDAKLAHSGIAGSNLLYMYAKPEKEDVSSQELDDLLLEPEAFFDSEA